MKKLNRFRSLFLVTLGVMTSGCGIYKGNFDCPVGEGVGCVSTSEVLDMIVEKASDDNEPFDTATNRFIPKKRPCR